MYYKSYKCSIQRLYVRVTKIKGVI